MKVWKKLSFDIPYILNGLYILDNVTRLYMRYKSYV